VSRQRLQREDFNRPTLRVARELLGKVLVRAHGTRRRFGTIIEVEAYKGPRDLASHAARGRRTPRVEPLYCDGGTIYVYLVYGMHWLLNFSTAGAGKPEGILIRGVLADPVRERRPVSGPGRVTQYLDIDKRLDGGDATTSTQLWIEDWGTRVPARSITTGPRVGVDYAGPYWASRPWRFSIARSVSSPDV
jgi:DNA-3-methyladenine glycosylase